MGVVTYMKKFVFCFRYLYFTDWTHRPSAQPSKIYKANLDGTSPTVLVSKMIQWPNGLSIDYASETLYWTDGFNEWIRALDLRDPNAEPVCNGNLVLIRISGTCIHIYTYIHTYRINYYCNG